MRIEDMNTRDYRAAMILYSSALKIVTAKLEVINEEFALRRRQTPIEYIKSRLKTADSISQKLIRRGCEPTLENARQFIDDIAGVRIICAFTDDIYRVAGIIESQLEINVLKVKDYIQNPEAQRLPELSYDYRGAGNVDRRSGECAAGNPDQDHCHGLLGQPGAQDEV